MQERMDNLILDKEKMKDKGVNTKSLKAERDAEFKQRMDELQKDQEQKVSSLREEYLKKIKASNNPAEKDKLLEEMGKRLKHVEGSLVEEKKRQEEQLGKMLKARQKKNLKSKEKEMDKEVDELEDQIDKMKANMGTEKAAMYAEKGVSGALDPNIMVKKQKISNALDEKFTGFQNELS